MSTVSEQGVPAPPARESAFAFLDNVAAVFNLSSVTNVIETARRSVVETGESIATAAGGLVSRGQVEYELRRNDFEARLKAALAMQPATPAVRTQLRVLKQADNAFRPAYRSGDYSTALAKLPALKAAVEGLEALKTDYDAAMKERAAIDTLLAAFAADYQVAKVMQPVTDNLAKLLSDLREADVQFWASYNRGQYAAARTQLTDLQAAVTALVAVKAAEHDAAEADAHEAATKIRDFGKFFTDNPIVEGVDNESLTLFNELVALGDACRAAWKGKDYSEALKKAKQSESRKADVLLVRNKDSYKDSLALKGQAEQRFVEITRNLSVEQALLTQPVDPAIVAALTALSTAWSSYRNARSLMQYDQLLKIELPRLETALEGVAHARSAVPDYDSRVLALKGECDTLRAERQTKLTQLGHFDPVAPGLQTDYKTMKDWSARADAAYQKVDYVECRAALQKWVIPMLDHFINKKPEDTKKAQASYDAQWLKVEPDHKIVSAWKQDVVYEMNADLSDLDKSTKEVQQAAGAGNFLEAERRLTQALAPLVAKLAALGPKYTKAEAARPAYLKAMASYTKIDQAATQYGLGTPHSDAQAAFDAFNAQNLIVLGHADAGNYADAVQELPALDQAADALLQKLADPTLVSHSQARDAANLAYQKADVDNRLNAVTYMKPLPGLAKSKTLSAALDKAFLDNKTAFNDAKSSGAWAAAEQSVLGLDSAIKDMEAYRAAYDTEVAARGKAADDAVKVAMDQVQIRGRDLKSQMDLLNALLAAPALTPEYRVAQREIYKAMKFDPQWEQEDNKKNDEVLAVLKSDPELIEAKDPNKWKSFDAAKRIKVLQRAVSLQSQVFGFEEPTISPTHSYTPYGGLAGEMRSDMGKIELNGATGMEGLILDDIQESLNTVLHENTHNYQSILADRFEKGELHPGDPDYLQAMVFATNCGDPGYLSPMDPAIPKAEYENQPREFHAFKRGNELAEQFLK